MTPRTPTLGRGLLACSAALLLALALAGCGRRGPLEPPDAANSAPAARAAVPADSRVRPSRATTAGQGAPPSTTLATRSGAVVEDAADDDEDEVETAQSVVPSPNPTPKKRGRATYVVPKEPFILDPLL